MKKVLLLSGFVMLFFSCEEDTLHLLNVNPKEAEVVDAGALFTYGQYNLAKQMADISVNNNVDKIWANYYTQTTYVQEANYDAVNRDVGGSIMDNIYTECLLELKKAKEIVSAEVVTDALLPVKNNKLAMITILEVFAYQYLVDNFGWIPYTEALDINNVAPSYDSDEDVYAAITAELEGAIADIDTDADSFGEEFDLFYGGDMSHWLKFANSLLLKIGIRQSEVNPTEANRLVDAAVAGGVFTSNSDNAVFYFTDTQPYINPLYDVFIVQKRASDYVVTQFFIDMLENRNDPRIDAYCDQNLAGGYVGGIYGALGNTYSATTQPSPTITDDAEYPGTLMDYSAVSFMLAEAVARGFTAGVAADYYEDGIRASFETWGLSSSQADDYLGQPMVDYTNSASGATFQEKIGIQKYLASYNQGHEAWTEARRLDYPVLLNGAQSGRPNPKRMIYPVEEKLINPNFAPASTAMGNDALTALIFWDVD